MYLFETHLPVMNTEKSLAFYVDVVGLQFAFRDRSRDIVFLWIGSNRRSMLGLWGLGTACGGDFHKCHFAIAVSFAELCAAGERLESLGVQCQNFFRQRTTEPSVIGWMPSAQLYFRDPDGHALEFIALLDDTPDPDFIGSITAWRAKA